MEHKPIRVINGTMEPFQPFWKVIDAANSESGEAEVEFYGPISEYSWQGDEITPEKFKNDLHTAGKGGPVRVKIDSTGGEIFAANAIRAILQDYPGKVTADIVGVAASAATIVITGADKVVMREGAIFMVHNPSCLEYGYASDLRKTAEVLDTIKEGILNVYVSKTGKSREELSALMDSETWMAADEAKELGFVDEVISGKKDKSLSSLRIPANMAAGYMNCLAMYDPLPANVTEIIQKSVGNAENEPTIESNVQPEAPTSEPPVDANAQEAKRLSDYLDIFG